MKPTPILVGILVLVCLFGGLFFLLRPAIDSDEPWNNRKIRLVQAAQESQVVIDAIDQYIRFKGRPPKSLEALIPDHMRWIPEPGIPGCGGFKYLNFGSGEISIVWYDLGPRSDKPVSTVGPTTNGDPRHAILLITLGPDDTIVDARFKRMPDNVGELDFDPEQWKNGSNRMQMALRLADHANLRRLPRPALLELLGPPDGSRTLRDTPWELRVVCSKGWTGRELFIYWPTGSYPDTLYGGTSEPVESWIYIHK